MNLAEQQSILRAGSAASEIAALCSFMAEALAADPDDARTSEAVEGIGRLATRVSADLLAMLGPKA